MGRPTGSEARSSREGRPAPLLRARLSRRHRSERTSIRQPQERGRGLCWAGVALTVTVMMAMTSAAAMVPAAGPVALQRRRRSPAVLALTLLAVTSSSFSALSLYHTLALKAEVAVLRTEVLRRREEQQQSASAPLSRDGGEGRHASGETEAGPGEAPADPRPGVLTLQRRSADRGAVGTGKSGSVPVHTGNLVLRLTADKQESSGIFCYLSTCDWICAGFNLLTFDLSSAVLQPCLQMMPNSKRSLTEKDSHTAIPWQTGLKRGCALEQDSDTILVKEEGFYFVYGQVYYMDKTFAMGHIIIRRKKNVVGDELQSVTLFRCIQNMDAQYPYNTCYTAGVVKLEEGDRVELLIPRKTAEISLDGDSTFFGAIKLV
ncbi:tumor necrosis factor ligand superfamily member 13B-like [Anguilla rostrata]|uniref:tumor necrosis factor ligand superfamily member 13B-like n=1 Tax=Anguilla rostrata TaxID=7938 RepID=UPI0030D4CC04